MDPTTPTWRRGWTWTAIKCFTLTAALMGLENMRGAATLIRSGMPVLDACHAALVEPLTDDAETIAALREVIHASLG